MQIHAVNCVQVSEAPVTDLTDHGWKQALQLLCRNGPQHSIEITVKDLAILAQVCSRLKVSLKAMLCSAAYIAGLSAYHVLKCSALMSLHLKLHKLPK